MSNIFFDHEKLKVYQKALFYIEWLTDNLNIRGISLNLKDQMERASNFIVLNIAEGNGKYTSKDRCRYFDIALGSTFESAACIDILFSKNLLTSDKTSEAKSILKEIASMLIGLIKNNSDRVYEDSIEYNTENK